MQFIANIPPQKKQKKTKQKAKQPPETSKWTNKQNPPLKITKQKKTRKQFKKDVLQYHIFMFFEKNFRN